MSYRYLKTSSDNKFASGATRLSLRRQVKIKLLALAVLGIGLFLLGNAVYPIVYYQIVLSPRFNSGSVDSFSYQQPSYNQPVLTSGLSLADYTQLSDWTSGTAFDTVNHQVVNYRLSIPRLKVQSAAVVVGGDDLKKSLIQYPGTPLPGNVGNPVIFGHSTLPQFSRPDNYKSIFTFLPNLEEGDDIWVDLDGVTYEYLVERLVEMGPHDMSILAQRYDDAYLTLVTCVPPGTYLKRLVVRARITKINP